MTLRTIIYDTTTHKIVPLEPTAEMRKACSRDRYWDEIDKEWEAMIAAAPEYQEPEDPPILGMIKKSTNRRMGDVL